MAQRCSSAIALVAVAALAGCAARREAKLREAWNAASGEPGAPEDGATSPEARDEDGPDDAPRKQGWERVEELLLRTVDVLTSAPSPEVLTELAAGWCEVEPVPRQTERGAVRVCYLYPTVRIQGVALALEMSDSGIVGFVAPELDAAKSLAIGTEASVSLEHLCASAWVRPDETLDVQTCSVEGGSTLAVGRVQPNPQTDRWQVSVAILGAI